MCITSRSFQCRSASILTITDELVYMVFCSLAVCVCCTISTQDNSVSAFSWTFCKRNKFASLRRRELLLVFTPFADTPIHLSRCLPPPLSRFLSFFVFFYIFRPILPNRSICRFDGNSSTLYFYVRIDRNWKLAYPYGINLLTSCSASSWLKRNIISTTNFIHTC